MQLTSASVLAFLGASSVDAWGSDGHKIVAQIAQNRLTSGVASKLDKILGGLKLTDVATWADDVRHQPEWSWSAPYHFINVPGGDCAFDYSRDCGDNKCVAGAINNYTAQMTSSDANTAAVGAKFVIHFVGDIHQPLHTAWTTDLGGNDIDVKLDKWDSYCSRYPPVNLHSVWDTCMIIAYEAKYSGDYHTRWEKYAAELSSNITSADEKSWGKWTGKGSVSSWANEGVHFACSKAYSNVDGKYITSTSDNELTADYFFERLQTVEERLKQGGVRLASVLNKAFA